ncbi:RagB/SusD family nutrient uptake outer membrane protein [Polaribacter batillariae]|uniref:RagB/SusD family nutrient uptake outer membrane protein n=1 Tax=Polaribacter batillariae TaxID=2808900 RepID=A0ABX7STR0_9FLAO|nr:RagB/SusD family nutrient uptake outer membrane protein [Polaribacter batillariae]QTD37637.1 RagB/SusD family nutrient uptake outer membrane protein [Polaribacter batillariae]
MRNIYIIVVLIMSSVFFTACNDDFLEVKSPNLLTDEDVANFPEIAEAQFLSLYAELRTNIQSIGAGRLNGPSGNMLSGYTDDAACGHAFGSGNGQAFSLGNINRAAGSVDSGIGPSLWPYRTIDKLNNFIIKFKDSSNDGVLNTVGEAYCLRAWLYFEIVKRYGGVPLHTDGISELSSISDRKTEAESWDFVLAEFDNAIALLPQQQPVLAENKDRVNKFTALALKARAGLYAGTIAKYGNGEFNNGFQGISSTKAQGYLKQGAEAAKLFVDTNFNYTLDANFGDIFNGKKEDSNEIIFRFQNNPQAGVTIFYDFWINSFKIKKQGFAALTNPHLDIVEQFETLDGNITPLDYTAQYANPAQFFEGRDKRLTQSIIVPGGTFLGETFDIYKETRVKRAGGAVETYGYNNVGDWRNGGTVPGYPQFTQSGIDGNFPEPGIAGTSVYGFYVKKLLYEAEKLDNSAILGPNQQQQDAIVVRYGEVLLTLAELAVELNDLGDGSYMSQGQQALNEVRSIHGGLPGKTLSKEVVRHERRIDLLYEGFRYWDLKRWRIGTEIHQKTYRALNPILNIDETTTPASIYYTIEPDVAPTYLGNTRIKWFEERDYYSPLPIADNPGLVQNIGW